MADFVYNINSNIPVGLGFRLPKQFPLDLRTVVNTLDERDAHVTNNMAYPGMMVYVTEKAMTYVYDGSAWKTLATSTSTDGSADINRIEDSDISALFPAASQS